MNAAPTANPYQLADPRRYVEMQAALSSSEFFRKKADEWDKEHGFKYHLVTAAMVLSCIWPLGLYALLFRTNPYRGDAAGDFATYERKHDEIAKAHGLPTMKEWRRELDRWLRTEASARPAPTRPAQARRPTPAHATLAA